jgi:transposase
MLLVTPGQRGDVTQAAAPGKVDAAYDFDRLVNRIAIERAKVVIPPNPSRSLSRRYDAGLYPEWNAVERLVNRLRLNRRIATRYENRTMVAEPPRLRALGLDARPAPGIVHTTYRA